MPLLLTNDTRGDIFSVKVWNRNNEFTNSTYLSRYTIDRVFLVCKYREFFYRKRYILGLLAISTYLLRKSL